jgi:hypothetical protein
VSLWLKWQMMHGMIDIEPTGKEPSISDTVLDALQSVIRDCDDWAGGLGSRLKPETQAKVRQALTLLKGQ